MAGGPRTYEGRTPAAYARRLLPPPAPAAVRPPHARLARLRGSTPPGTTAAATAAPLAGCSPGAPCSLATLGPRPAQLLFLPNPNPNPNPNQVLFILLVTCGEMAIVLCYFQVRVRVRVRG